MVAAGINPGDIEKRAIGRHRVDTSSISGRRIAAKCLIGFAKPAGGLFSVSRSQHSRRQYLPVSDYSQQSKGARTAVVPPNRRGLITLSAQRGTVRCRSACVHTLRPLARADTFRSSDARRIVQRTSACPPNRWVFPRPSPECCGLR